MDDMVYIHDRISVWCMSVHRVCQSLLHGSLKGRRWERVLDGFRALKSMTMQYLAPCKV